MPPIATGYDLRHGFRDPREEAYSIAANRAYELHDISPWEDDKTNAYDLANHIVDVVADRRLARTQAMHETCLHEHIERWKWDTAHLSSMKQMLAHPSYLQIIQLAKYFSNFEVERALLRELQTEPTYWFDALVAITGEDPVLEKHDFDEAVNAWLEWGRNKGII
jgi:hypothetical protein